MSAGIGSGAGAAALCGTRRIHTACGLRALRRLLVGWWTGRRNGLQLLWSSGTTLHENHALFLRSATHLRSFDVGFTGDAQSLLFGIRRCNLVEEAEHFTELAGPGREGDGSKVRHLSISSDKRQPSKPNCPNQTSKTNSPQTTQTQTPRTTYPNPCTGR